MIDTSDDSPCDAARSTPTGPRRREIEIEVRYAETDQMGVVHHSHYVVWFEQARTALCLESGYHYADIERLGYWLMVTGVRVSYRGGARYGERVQVGAWVELLKSRVLHFGYDVRRGNELLVTGITEHVWVEAASRKPCRIPEAVRPAFERLAGARTTPLK